MASGSQNMTTYLAKHLIGDSTNVNWAGALLHSGTDGKTNAMDTWLFADDYGTAAAPWGIKHDQTNNKIVLVGNNVSSVWSRLDTGDTYILGKVGINYNPETSGNTYQLYVNGNTYHNGGIWINQPADHRNYGIIGTYDYTKAAAIWSMGNSYQIAANGANLGTLYGAAYVYQGQGGTGGKTLAGGHQFVWAENGVPQVALGNKGIYLKKGGGIYWDPYVESSSDASDVTQIYQIASGVAGGTELRIQQANDAADVINLVTPKSIYLNSKEAFNVSDSWLRINENAKFTSGVYFGSSTVRTDGEFWSDRVRIVDDWVGFYNAVQGGTRYGFLEVTSTKYYFRKENGADSWPFDFNGNIYTSGIIRTDNEIRGDQIRLYDNWVGFYQSANAGGNRYGYIQCNANRMYFVKENGVNTYHFDFGGHIYTPNNVYAHGIWANQTNGEKQVGVDNGTAGNLYLWSNNSEKGIYSSSGYMTGYIIRITSNRVYFADAYTRTNTALAYSQSALGYDSYTYLAGWNGYELRAVAKTQFARASHTHPVSQITWANGQNLSCTGGGEWSVDMSGDGYWHVWSGAQGRSTLICYNSNSYVAVPIHLYVGGYNNTSYGLSASSIACNGNLWVSANNATGGGIILSDDGDIVDLNDGYCAMRFSYGVRIFNANRGGSAVINLNANGIVYCNSVTASQPNGFRTIWGNKGFIIRNDQSNTYFMPATNASEGNTWYSYYSYVENGNGYWHFPRAYGAVWNDYAEYRIANTIEPGRVVKDTKNGKMELINERLAPACKVISDTYGFAIGETVDAKTPIAVSGRVLVYPYQSLDKYEIGAAVCSAPGGTVDIMTRDEIMQYPERIIGTVSEIPDYEIWRQTRPDVSGNNNPYTHEVLVRGRIWIYVK